MRRTRDRVADLHSGIGPPRNLVRPTGGPSIASESTRQFELELPVIKPVAPAEVLTGMWAGTWVEVPVRGVGHHPRVSESPQSTMHQQVMNTC